MILPFPRLTKAEPQRFITVNGKPIPIGGASGGGKPGQQPAGQPAPAQGPQSEADLPADVKPLDLGSLNLGLLAKPDADWSAEAQHAFSAAQAQRRLSAYAAEQMLHGPYYKDGRLHIPSTVFDPKRTPLANAEWKKRGLRYDSYARTWSTPVSLANATDQVRRARAVFDQVFDIRRDETGRGHYGWEEKQKKALVKAAAPVRWITLPGGRHIPISEGQGRGAEMGPVATEQGHRSETNTAEGLSHDDMVKIAGKVAGQMGIDPGRLQVNEKDETDPELGEKVGEYDPASGKLNLYPASFAHGKEQLVGTLAHEQSHADFDRVVGRYNQERAAIQGGANAQAMEAYQTLKEVRDSPATFARADGQTKYDELFWKRYQANPNANTYMDAVSETLAETTRLVQTGRASEAHPLWRALAGRVRQLAKGE